MTIASARSRIRRLLACLCLLSCATIAHARQQDDPAPRPQVIGYVMDGDALPSIDARKLDVVNFAFAHVNPSHEVHLPGDTATQMLQQLVALKRDNPRLRIVLSIGGWGSGNFSEAAATPQARARFAATAIALMRRHRIDGLDIDWEYPTLAGPGISHSPDDRDNFTAMLRDTRAQLDAEGARTGTHYLLTIAAADGEAARGLDLPRIAPLLDWINLMTYDFHGSLTPTTGHHAALWRSASAAPEGRTTAGAVEEFLAAGVPAGKINVGVAFYGRKFAGVRADNDGLHQPYREHEAFLSWRDIQAHYLDRDGYVRRWDERAQAPTLWNAQERAFITYDDPQSLRAKAHYVRARGLGGIMYWEHRQDDGALLDAVREGLYGP